MLCKCRLLFNLRQSNNTHKLMYQSFSLIDLWEFCLKKYQPLKKKLSQEALDYKKRHLDLWLTDKMRRFSDVLSVISKVCDTKCPT